MLDLDNLRKALISAINSASSLTLIHNKTSTGQTKDVVTKPYCTVSVISAPALQRVFGSTLMVSQVLVQFSVFSTSETEAATLCRSIASLFDRSTVTLTGQTFLAGTYRGDHQIVEGRDTNLLIYHHSVDIEFLVSSV